MSYPRYNNFRLQDINGTGVITSNIRKFSTPDRTMQTEALARRPGSRILNSEFGERTVVIEGYILADNTSDLQDKIDDFNRSVTSKNEAQLAISGTRTGTATVVSLDINEQSYNTSYVPFSLELLMSDPFFYQNQVDYSVTLPSGTNEHTISTTYSGSIYMHPFITITPTDALSGDTQTKRIDIQYNPTGGSITWSGGVGDEYIEFGTAIQFDYESQLITKQSVTQDSRGVFDDFQPTAAGITVTFSGEGDWPGGTLEVAYQPRFL